MNTQLVFFLIDQLYNFDSIEFIIEELGFCLSKMRI